MNLSSLKYRLAEMIFPPVPLRFYLLIFLMKKFKIGGFRRNTAQGWNDCMYVHHNFNHTEYNKNIAALYKVRKPSQDHV